MLFWILVAAVIFEFFFAWDCFKRKLMSEALARSLVAVINEKEKDLLHTSQLVKLKCSEANQLREILDRHGVEWEEEWRETENAVLNRLQSESRKP